MPILEQSLYRMIGVWKDRNAIVLKLPLENFLVIFAFDFNLATLTSGRINHTTFLK